MLEEPLDELQHVSIRDPSSHFRKKGDVWLADRVYSGIPAGLFGLSQVVDIGPMSGISNVSCWLEERGLSYTQDDVTRILQSEAHMLETNLGAVLETRIANAIAILTVVAVMICGGVCILCAGILLLHQWLPLWQSFGLAGVGILIVGIVRYAIMKPAVGPNSA